MMAAKQERKLENGGVESVAPPETWNEDHIREFLTVNYHYLTRSIQPYDFFSYLRSKNVFNESDQEEVENKYNNTWLKAGHLIDIIARKGRKGFAVFMEVIEYTEQDLYEKLTGRQPRTAPKDFSAPSDGSRRRIMRSRLFNVSRRKQRTESTQMLDTMAELTSMLSRTVVEKKSEITELNECIKKLQKQLKEESKENQDLLDLINELKFDNEQLISEKEELDCKIEFQKKEVVRLEVKVDEMNAAMETLKKELEQEKKKCERKVQNLQGEIKRSQTVCGQRFSLENENPLQNTAQDSSNTPDVKINGAGHRPRPQPPTPPVKNATENQKLEKEVEKLKTLLHQYGAELNDLKEQLKLTQESCDAQEAITVQLRHENQTMCQRNEELESRQRELIRIKDKLEQECHEFEKRYRDVELLNRTLYVEIDAQRGKQNPERRQNMGQNPGQGLLSCLRDVHRIAAIASTGGTSPTSEVIVPCPTPPPFPSASKCAISNNSGHLGRSKSDGEDLPPRSCQQIIRQPRVGAHPMTPDMAQRRQGSISLKGRSLVLYVNGTMETKLTERLQIHCSNPDAANKFRYCSYDFVKTLKEVKEMLENFEIVHYNEIGSGSSRTLPVSGPHGISSGNLGYSCINTDRLRSDLQQFDAPMLIKPLPVPSLKRMSRANLLPVIVFVKHSTASLLSKLHSQEEDVRKAELPYETITVQDEDLKKDCDKACDDVIEKLHLIVTQAR